MDCEKFEPLLLDELYDELDDVTRVSLRRHVAGCARCSGILADLRHTQDKLDTWAPVDVPDDLEARILASVREAQKVTPLHGRAGRALSIAGRWAMRPQTAMAAVFLLMVGSSAFLLRANSTGRPSAAVSVTVAGEPASSLAGADHDSLDDKAAAAAHGAAVAHPVAPAPVSPAAVAAREGEGAPARSVGAMVAQGEAPAETKAAAEAPSGLQPAPVARLEDQAGEDDARSRGAAKAAAADAVPAKSKGSVSAADGMATGMAAYRARNYPEATRAFDAAAQAGDTSAALWAAKSVRDGSGCGAAMGRFRAVATQSAGTWSGNEALLEEAKCEAALGQREGARSTLQKLLGVASHKDRAQAALDELDGVASRRAATPGPAAAAGAAPPAAKARPAEAVGTEPSSPLR